MTAVIIKADQRIRVVVGEESIRVVVRDMAGRGLPPGGTTGQVLVKASNDDYDCEWVNPT